jgi:hypothetical protein
MENDNLVIQRFLSFDATKIEEIKRDLKPLVRLINSSGGEYSLQFRNNYFSIYNQGNSLAKLKPNNNGSYTASIHKEFLGNGIEEQLAVYSLTKDALSDKKSGQKYVNFRINSKDIHPFFQRKHLDRLSRNIRKVNAGEEVTMEQVIITDNPPSPNFIIVDRQVADHKSKAQIDLLALKRNFQADKFHFLVIEVKLGRNPELREKVGGQLNSYVAHIKTYITDYADCYQENYRQKFKFGLLEADMPPTVKINKEPDSVEGLVVVCGYSGIAKGNIAALNKAIVENNWDIKIHQMMLMPKLG